MTSIRDYFRTCTGSLAETAGAEARDIVRIIFEDVAGYDRTFIFANGDREITPYMQQKISDAIARVRAGEPVQYVVGKARFMGYDFKVDRDTLIPRPETEGLVDMITDDYGSCSRHLACLDVGTGSGCIAISLALALRDASVVAIDISEGALSVARENARSLSANVDFRKADALHLKPEPARIYDFIVSNPPYILPREASEMDSRVLDYEPAQALFVQSDSDPLLFYKAIAEYGRSALKQGGRLYFEINSDFPKETVAMLRQLGYSGAEAIRDYRGLYRYVKATLG